MTQADQDGHLPETDTRDQNSYGQIIKSSSIMAGSASVTMLMALVRMKFAALFMGSAGVGLLAALSNLQLLISTIAGLGLQTSAVREIADAVGRNDLISVAARVQILRKISMITGLIGMVVTVLLGNILSLITFGTTDYAADICMLGLAVLVLNLAGAHLATIQGMRQIGSLARVNIASALIATFITLLLYYFYGVHAIAPSLVAVATCQFLFARYFARRIPLDMPVLSWKSAIESAGPMVKLGLALMWSSVIAQLGVYLLTAFITSTQGLASTGIYSAASMVSGVFVGFVLSAMSADFYPRLAGLSSKKEQMCDLVNQQTEIGLLMSLPGLIVTMALADLALLVFYSEELTQGSGLLAWFVLGCFIRVVTWPLGFTVLALGRKGLHATIETIFNLGSLFIIIPAIHFFGLEAGAIAYVFCYLLYGFGIYLIVRKLIGLKWSVSVVNMIWRFSLVLVLLLLGFVFLSSNVIWGVGSIVAIVVAVFNVRGLLSRLGNDHRISRAILRIPGMRFLKSN
ncbi:oligosaccharide flippase family protein [Limnobacter sp.]|uniref:oligosaccharide flippase family protein n=1 Tax=Limnobacter sp. TaxID=2003368 RepID=UPI0027B8E8E6|nr:oligosaccharide flippase family protein [Limnobacter sp.]